MDFAKNRFKFFDAWGDKPMPQHKNFLNSSIHPEFNNDRYREYNDYYGSYNPLHKSMTEKNVLGLKKTYEGNPIEPGSGVDSPVRKGSKAIQQHYTNSSYENPTILNNYSIPDHLKELTKPDERMDVIATGMQDPVLRMEFSDIEQRRRAEKIRKNAQNEYNAYREQGLNDGRKNIFKYFDTKTRAQNVRNLENNTDRDMEDDKRMKQSIVALMSKVNGQYKSSREEHFDAIDKQSLAIKANYYPHGKINLKKAHERSAVNTSLPFLDNKDVYQKSNNEYQRNKMRLGNHASHM